MAVMAAASGTSGSPDQIFVLLTIGALIAFGAAVDGRTDQYALACTAFELLTGAPPFRREDMAAAIAAQIMESPPSLTPRRPDLHPGLDGVFARALAKEPSYRFPACGDFADALRAVAGLPAYQPESSPSPRTHPPTRIA